MSTSNAHCLIPGCQGRVTILEGPNHIGFEWYCTCGMTGSCPNGTKPDEIFDPVNDEVPITMVVWIRPLITYVDPCLPI